MPSGSYWETVGTDALGGAATGAGIGSLFGLPGAAIGGGIGALAGAGIGLLQDDPEDVYNELMQKYLTSPEYLREVEALDKMKVQAETMGPTAQEQTALRQALIAANQHFGSSYGAILEGLTSRMGAGGVNAAALAAAEGQGRAGNMASMASSAASQEADRRERAREAYANMASRAQQIGDEYRRWASGEGYKRSAISNDVAMGVLTQAGNAAGAVGAAYKRDQPKTLSPQDAGSLAGGVRSMYPDPFPAAKATPAADPAQAAFGAPSGGWEGGVEPAPTAAEIALGKRPVMPTWQSGLRKAVTPQTVLPVRPELEEPFKLKL